MSLTGRPSSIDDRESITALMRQNLDLPLKSPAIEPAVQDWKYWKSHPLFEGTRSHLVRNNEQLVSHGCLWPIRLQSSLGTHDAFHLIDWVADRSANGAGMKVLQDCANGRAAVFSIGGSDAGQKVVAAFGFKPANRVWTLGRPLRLLSSAQGSVHDWKSPARFLRDAVRSLYPRPGVDPHWHCNRMAFRDIPENLYPTFAKSDAVSVRNAKLLEHIASCPRFSLANAYLLTTSSRPVAYFVLAQVGREVRLIDFGPSDLDKITARMVGTYAQLSASADFRDAGFLVAATTEDTVREGFLGAGLRLLRERTVRVLKQDPALRDIQTFRLTMMDWDASYL